MKGWRKIISIKLLKHSTHKQSYDKITIDNLSINEQGAGSLPALFFVIYHHIC